MSSFCITCDGIRAKIAVHVRSHARKVEWMHGEVPGVSKQQENEFPFACVGANEDVTLLLLL